MSVTIRRLAALLILPSATAWAQGFPVNTNYPSAGGTLPDLTRLTVPSYEHYSQATTDGYAPTQQEYEGALALAAQQFAQIVTLNDLADVQEGLAAVQIVSGHVVGPTLFTLAFPPNWRRTDRHPIYLSGAPTGYSNNYRVFPNGEAAIIAYAAARGFIVAYCNAGGVESQGISDNVLRAVGTAMNELGTLGGDKQKIIAAGFSRGAATSVVWAANPLGLDYNVVAIFGHALPVSTIASVVTPYATYPMLGWLSDLITNDPARSTYGSPTPPHQFPNYELKILTNQDDNTEQRSALAVMDALRGKQLLFSMSTHDPFLPLPEGIAFDHELSARNIPHASIVVYGEGHLLSLSVASEFFHAVDLIGAGQSYTVQPGRYIASQPDLTAHDYTRQRFENRPMLPFTAAVPFRVGVGQPLRVDVCGTPGTQFRLCAVGQGGQAVLDFSGQIPPEECVKIPGAAPAAVGSYDWRVEVGGAPMARSLSSIAGAKPTLTIEATQPAHLSAMPSQLPVLLGFSELSSQVASDPAACPAIVTPPDAGLLDSGGALDQGIASLDAEPTDLGAAADAAEAPRDAGFAMDGAEADAARPLPAKRVVGCGCSTEGGAGGDHLMRSLVLLGLLGALGVGARRRPRARQVST